MTATPAGVVVLGVLGIGLILGGGYALTDGVSQLNTCGGTELVANEVSERPDEYTAFSNLTAQQQDLAEQAIRGEDPTVTTSEEWPWFEDVLRVQYQGNYYEFYTVTSSCAIPPSIFIGTGAVGSLLGFALVAIATRQYRTSRSTA